MKKIACLIVGMATMATMAFGQQTNVLSANAVGYIKTTLEPGDFYFIQTPFVAIDGSPQTVETVLQDNIPVNSKVFVWSSASQSYSEVVKLTPTFWNPQNVALERGAGFFIQTPAGGSAVDQFTMGEVPGGGTYPTTDISLVEGFNAIGNPYPTAITIEDSGLQAATSAGDEVSIWNSSSQSYSTVAKLTDTFWNPANVVINPGDALFVTIGDMAGSTYTETVPYLFPSN